MAMATMEMLAKDGAERRELLGWCGLAMASLTVAGLFAVLVAVARIPGIENLFHLPADFFYRGLVVHVVFAFVIFFLAVAAAMFLLALLGTGSVRFRFLGPAGLVLSWASFPLMLLPAFLESGTASLNNYVPAIIHPLYYLGLGALAGGVGLSALRLIINRPPGTNEIGAASSVVYLAAWIYLLAVAGTLYAWSQLHGEAISAGVNEELFWGGGHILQFANTGLLIAAWVWLAARVTESRPSTLVISATGIWLTLAALAGLGFYAGLETFSTVQRQAFTDLQYALAPPTVAGALAVLATLRRGGVSFRQPAAFAFLLSIIVFAWGGALGMFVDGADTRTPAHYHAMIGGLMAAYMALFYHLFLPLGGRSAPSHKHQNRQQLLFVGGTIVQTAGLFLAGGYGTPRKTAGAEQGLTDLGAQIGLYMNGVGGLMAVIGGVMFVWMVGRRLVKAKAGGAV